MSIFSGQYPPKLHDVVKHAERFCVLLGEVWAVGDDARVWLVGRQEEVELGIRCANPVLADGGRRRILSRMTSATIWSERVADWRSSGLTSKKFCEGREFTAGGLRHWAHLLGRDSKVPLAEGGTRLARVVRVASPRKAGRAGSPSARCQETATGGLVVEYGSS